MVAAIERYDSLSGKQIQRLLRRIAWGAASVGIDMRIALAMASSIGSVGRVPEAGVGNIDGVDVVTVERRRMRFGPTMMGPTALVVFLL